MNEKWSPPVCSDIYMYICTKCERKKKKYVLKLKFQPNDQYYTEGKKEKKKERKAE